MALAGHPRWMKSGLFSPQLAIACSYARGTLGGCVAPRSSLRELRSLGSPQRAYGAYEGAPRPNKCSVLHLCKGPLPLSLHVRPQRSQATRTGLVGKEGTRAARAPGTSPRGTARCPPHHRVRAPSPASSPACSAAPSGSSMPDRRSIPCARRRSQDADAGRSRGVSRKRRGQPDARR